MINQQTSQRRYQAAIDKAERLQWWRQAERIADVWMVRSESRRSTFYVVECIQGRWTCTCQAGQVGTPCFHSASAFLATLRDQAGTQPATRAHAAPSLRMVRDGAYTEYACSCRACQSAHPADAAPLAARARGPRCEPDTELPSFSELVGAGS